MIAKNYREIFETLRDITLAKQERITDFNQGSVISSLYEAIASVVENIYIEGRIGYDDMLKSVPRLIFGFTPKAGNKASAKVVFSRAKPIESRTVIPISTKIASGGYVFITTESGVIEPGATQSNQVSVQAEDIGLDYNVPANTITSLSSVVPLDVVEVTNPVKASGGTNAETDAEIEARFKLYINGLQGGNTYGIKSAALSVEGVRSVSVEEHFPPLNNIYGFTIYVDDGTGGMSKELQTAIEDKMNGDDTSVNPGQRPAGVFCKVLSATPVPVAVDVTCYIYRVDRTKAESEIRLALEEEINGLGIAENVVLTSLILRLRRLGYVKDVKIATPKDNITITKSQIARFESANVILEEMQ